MSPSYESVGPPPIVLRPGRTRRRPSVGARSLVIAAAFGLLVLASSLVDFGADHLHARLFNAAAEWSWSHIAATIAFALGSLAGLLCGWRGTRPARRAWLATGALFGVLLLDNVTRLHTHMSFWPVVYAPILIGLSVSVWMVVRGTREAGTVLAGLALLLVSVGIHVLGPHLVHALGWGVDSWAYQVKVGLKEGTELAGWLLVVPALWRLLPDRSGGRDRDRPFGR